MGSIGGDGLTDATSNDSGAAGVWPKAATATAKTTPVTRGSILSIANLIIPFSLHGFECLLDIRRYINARRVSGQGVSRKPPVDRRIMNHGGGIALRMPAWVYRVLPAKGLRLSDRSRPAADGCIPGDDLAAFERQYVYRTRNRMRLRVPRDANCSFLKDDRCSIHPAKPTQCRIFPFWPELVESRREWRKTARYCPGMGKGPLIQIEAARQQAQEIAKAIRACTDWT